MVFHEFLIYHNARNKLSQFREYRHSHFLYLRASMNFGPYSPHLPTDLDDTRPKRPAHNAVDYLSVCFVKVAQGRPYFLLDINVITFTQVPCNIMQAKNALVHRYSDAVRRLEPRICNTYSSTARTHGTPVFLFPVTSMCQHELTQLLFARFCGLQSGVSDGRRSSRILCRVNWKEAVGLSEECNASSFRDKQSENRDLCFPQFSRSYNRINIR